MNRRLPPGRQARPAEPPRQPGWTHGPVERVPCPACGKPNSMVELASQQLLDTGHRITCEHCHRVMEVVAIKVITAVSVRPFDARAAAARGAAQATTISPGQLQRLLK